MTPYYSDDWLTVYAGDCRDVLRTLPDESVHCVVTSPPYWGLRDYGTATWIGGDAGCDHLAGPLASQKSGLNEPLDSKRKSGSMPFRDTCGKCGATRIDSQLGLEPTPEQYVENMVGVFREVRRVLRNDGTLWLNLGDSYVSNPGDRAKVGGFQANPDAARLAAESSMQSHNKHRSGLKPKDLVGIPWRVAFALQADGWYLRSDIIWAKPNPMPESVTDRPTKSHEYVFLLAKSQRYYFDQEAVRESGTTGAWGAMPPIGGVKHPGNNGNATYSGNQPPSDGNRNIRSVWTIPTQPYPGAHFAVFPPKLVEPCVKAGSSEKGVCPECGAPWVRVTESDAQAQEYNRGRREGRKRLPDTYRAPNPNRGDLGAAGFASVSVTTTGWQASCACDAEAFEANRSYPEPVPAVVLDPFAGSGTVGMVAQSLSRRAVLIDLNPAYIEQQMKRNQDMPLGLTA